MGKKSSKDFDEMRDTIKDFNTKDESKENTFDKIYVKTRKYNIKMPKLKIQREI